MSYQVNRISLPDDFPTDRNGPEFWEALGRAVATFSFLEEMLKRAIFALTGSKKMSASEIKERFPQWVATLEASLHGQMSNLITTYGEAVRSRDDVMAPADLETFVAALRAAAKRRNVLCHGSWSPPRSDGASLPFFVSKQDGVFDTPIDIHHLKCVQQHVRNLACDVIDSVTRLGVQFPGSGGPGIPL